MAQKTTNGKSVVIVGPQEKSTIVSNFDYIKNCTEDELALFLTVFEMNAISQALGNISISDEIISAENMHLRKWLDEEFPNSIGEYLN